MVTQFVTDEGRRNRTRLYASLNPAVAPEPGAALLFAVGALVVGGALRREARS
jgi:hypothetical protein